MTPAHLGWQDIELDLTGVPQGLTPSPTLFDIYAEPILEAL